VSSPPEACACSMQVSKPWGCARRPIQTIFGVPKQWEMSLEQWSGTPSPKGLPKPGGNEVGQGAAEGTSVLVVPGADPREAPSTPQEGPRSIPAGCCSRFLGDLWGNLKCPFQFSSAPAPGQLLLVPSPPRPFHSLKSLFTKSKCFTVS